jgi:hypothetical protein
MDRKGEMSFSVIARSSLSIVLFLLIGSNLCRADTPTAEELCRKRNAASCEASGLTFFIEEGCPRGTKTLRPKGTERCEQLRENTAAESRPQADAVRAPSAPLAVAETAKPGPEAASGFFGSAYFFVLLIGLVQGLISRAAPGPLVTVLVVMPLLGTWVMLSGAAAPPGTAAYWGPAAMVLLQTFICSVAGWGVGMAIRKAVFKLPFR